MSGGLKALGADAFEPLIAAAGPADAALARLGALALPGPVRERLAAVAALIAGLDGVTVTLDPTERHGFEYQTWIGFSLFGAGITGEVGRGGAYRIMRPDGSAEPAIGFSLYIDALVDQGLGQAAPKRILLPPGTPASVGAKLRAQGWATVAALHGRRRSCRFSLHTPLERRRGVAGLMFSPRGRTNAQRHGDRRPMGR